MKYFYKDPLEAAYMAKHYGMKFYARNTDEQMSEYDLPESQRNYDWFHSHVVDGWHKDIETVEDAVKWIEDASDKIYVDPECYEMLKPQVGDFVYECIKDGKTTIETIATHNGNPIIREWLGEKIMMTKYEEVPASWGKFGTYPITRTDTVCGKSKIEIIQRQGKAWFQPEMEEV